MRGRHRRGAVPRAFVRREWDRAQRADAAELDEAEHRWLVMYRPGSRRFHAIATGTGLAPMIVEARTSEELRELMRDAELPELPGLSPAAGAPKNPSPHLRQGAPMTTPDDPRTASWDLPCEPAIVSKARSMVHGACRDWGVPPVLIDDLVLVVSELLGNAVVYGRPPIRLELWARGEGLCARVTDHGPEDPRFLESGLDSVHGRGLPLVQALADRWGVVTKHDGTGKTVWAMWRWPSRRPAPTQAADLTALVPRPRPASDPAGLPRLVGEGTGPI